MAFRAHDHQLTYFRYEKYFIINEVINIYFIIINIKRYMIIASQKLLNKIK